MNAAAIGLDGRFWTPATLAQCKPCATQMRHNGRMVEAQQNTVQVQLAPRECKASGDPRQALARAGSLHEASWLPAGRASCRQSGSRQLRPCRQGSTPQSPRVMAGRT
jgi:hypothetical protein